jgi:hypothetical protein
VLAVTTTTVVPLRSSDVALLTRLGAKLLSRPLWPGGLELGGLRDAVERSGFRLLEDARERYAFTVRDRDDAELALRAVYLPGTTERRRQATIEWLAGRVAESGPVEIPVPVRRLVAARQG